MRTYDRRATRFEDSVAAAQQAFDAEMTRQGADDVWFWIALGLMSFFVLAGLVFVAVMAFGLQG